MDIDEERQKRVLALARLAARPDAGDFDVLLENQAASDATRTPGAPPPPEKPVWGGRRSQPSQHPTPPHTESHHL
ncbi:hypothetical protein ACWD25_09190, partial [Streptomyces sp. NPDC002920]